LAAPLYPGQFPSVALNLYNLILAVDMSNRHTLVWIYQHAWNLITRKFTFRWGIVPLVDTPEAAKAARLFRYVYTHYGPEEVMDYIRSVRAFLSFPPPL
jgi:UDP-glucose:glycoprotein glucosyltransferase